MGYVYDSKCTTVENKPLFKVTWLNQEEMKFFKMETVTDNFGKYYLFNGPHQKKPIIISCV